MKKIASFNEFINEANGGFLSLIAPLFGQLELEARAKEEAAKRANSGETVSSDQSSVDQGALLPANFNPAPGNDDFTLYMQHQQGVAGAKGLIEASLGTGNLAPDTIKTKGGVKYANLIQNVPSDKPQVKNAIIKALDSGDQKTAAALFLNMWKEKWNTRGAEAKIDINKPQNASVKQTIQKYSSEYGVPFDFAATVAKIESGFNPKAGNNTYKGLYALSQSGFNKYVPGGSIFNADDNAKAGIQILRDNIKAFKKSLKPETLASLNIAPWAKNLA